MGGLAVHGVEAVVGHHDDVDVGARHRQQLTEGAVDELVLSGDELPFGLELRALSGREALRLESPPVEMAGDVDPAEVEQDQIVVLTGYIDRQAAEKAIRFEH